MLKVGIRNRMRVGRNRGRRAPAEFRDGVEEWARKHGRHANLKYLDEPMNCWAVMLSYKAGDPRHKDGTQDEPVFLHRWRDAEWWAKFDPDRAKRHHRTNVIKPHYQALDIMDIGLTGIIEILDKGDLLSGRGEHKSAEAAGRATVDKFRTDKHRRRLAARDEAGHRAKDIRRRLLKIPFLPVGIEFNARGDRV